MEEIWKNIQGFEGLYQVSNLGRVKSFRRSTKFGAPDELILHPSIISSGYAVVTLYSEKGRAKRQVHRLVASAFIPNPNNFPCVNHKDENKLNNFVENLEWCTYQYNNNYGTAKIRAIETASHPIRQMTINKEEIATYKSAKIASILLGYKYRELKSWLQYGSGGGYMWSYIK